MNELDPCLVPRLTRRRLVVAGGTAAAGLLFMGGPPAAVAAAGGPAYLRRSSYRGLTGTTFKAISETGAAVSLRLTAVSDLARAKQMRSLAGHDDAFALTFTGPSGALGSGIRALRHPRLGWVSLFITPAGRPGKTQSYEVVVDRVAVR